VVGATVDSNILTFFLIFRNKYRFQLTDFCDYMVPGGGAQYTPGRLLYLDEWGPIRHAANVGYICLLAAKLGIRSRAYRRFAHGQLSYMLGTDVLHVFDGRGYRKVYLTSMKS